MYFGALVAIFQYNKNRTESKSEHQLWEIAHLGGRLTSGETRGVDSLSRSVQPDRLRKLLIQEVNFTVKNENNVCNYKTNTDHVAPLYYNLIKSDFRN